MKKMLNTPNWTAWAAFAAALMVPGFAHAACNVGAASALPYSVPAAGLNGSVTISAPAGCPWTFTSRGSAFVQILSASSGSGSAVIYFRVLANTTGRARTASFGPLGVTAALNNIAGRTSISNVVSNGFEITLTQAAR